MKIAVFRLILQAAGVIVAVTTADSRTLSSARQAHCALTYCVRQVETCLQACHTTTTDAANRDHTLALCRDFCRREDEACRTDLCRVSRARRK